MINLSKERLQRLETFLAMLQEGNTKTISGQMEMYGKIDAFLEEEKESGHKEGYELGVKKWEQISKN